MAAAPSALALYSDFAGSAGSPYPSGWELGLFSGETGWQLDGSGNAQPSGSSWRIMATTTGFTRGASNGGIIVEWSVIPANLTVNMVYLAVDKTLDSFDGYAFRWQRGNDLQLQKWVAGSGSYLDGTSESSITGTIGPGFLMALMLDNGGVTAYASTDGGSNWQQIGTSTDTAHTGTVYGAVEADATSTSQPKVTNVWFGEDGAGASALTIKTYKSVAEVLAYADPSADGANNAWTKSTGTAGWSLLDDGVRSPTAPSTGTDQITSGTAGQLQDLVLPNTLTYTAGAEYTLWIYSSSGAKRGLSTLISVNDSSFANSAALHGASAAFAWRSRDISSLIASQGNLDGLRVRLSVDSTAGGGGAGVVTVAAVYVRKYIAASSAWLPVKLKYGSGWAEKLLKTP